MPLLLLLAIISMAAFLVSCAFHVWVELARPSFFFDTVFGRVLAVIGVAPMIATYGVSIIATLPWMFLWAILADENETLVWEDAAEGLGLVWFWFTDVAPNFVRTGE